MTALPLDGAPVRQVGYGARVLTAEVTFPAPREGIGDRAPGTRSLIGHRALAGGLVVASNCFLDWDSIGCPAWALFPSRGS